MLRLKKGQLYPTQKRNNPYLSGATTIILCGRGSFHERALCLQSTVSTVFLVRV